MPESFDDLKYRFHQAVDEFIEAIYAHRDAHAEAMLTESADLDQRYLAALEDRDRKQAKYRELARQMDEAKNSKKF